MDIWQVLRDRWDCSSFVPTPFPAVERADLKRRDGSPYTMLKNPHGDGGAGRYVRLEAADVELYERMDGQRTIQEILVAHLERSGSFAIDRLARPAQHLRVNGLFRGAASPLYAELLRRRARPAPRPGAWPFARRL